MLQCTLPTSFWIMAQTAALPQRVQLFSFVDDDTIVFVQKHFAITMEQSFVPQNIEMK